MNSKTITEIASFNTISGTKELEFIEIVDALEKEFHMNQKGYIDSELIKGKEENQWIMIQHWETKNDAIESSRRMMQDEITEKFRNSLDSKSVKLSYLKQILKLCK